MYHEGVDIERVLLSAELVAHGCNLLHVEILRTQLVVFEKLDELGQVHWDFRFEHHANVLIVSSKGVKDRFQNQLRIDSWFLKVGKSFE